MRALVALSALVALVGILLPDRARAIQGCTLQNPDRDIRRIFPKATDYRTHFLSLEDRGGKTLYQKLAERLGDQLDPVYEAMDLPYAYYEVLDGKKVIGYVFGVNQKGRYGGMQLILGTDTQGKILHFYYQKLSSGDREAFLADSFTSQFQGLTLGDFYYHRGYRELGVERKEDKVAGIRTPAESPAARYDFEATLRGIKKNLILFDLLWLEDRHGDVFKKIRDTVEKKKGGK